MHISIFNQEYAEDHGCKTITQLAQYMQNQGGKQFWMKSQNENPDSIEGFVDMDPGKDFLFVTNYS